MSIGRDLDRRISRRIARPHHNVLLAERFTAQRPAHDDKEAR